VVPTPSATATRPTTATATPTAMLTATATATQTQVATPTATQTPTAAATPISTVSFVGQGPLADSAGPLTTISVGRPSGVMAGDVLLAQIVVYDATGTNNPTAPTGWNAIRHDSVNNGNKLTSWLYFRIAGGSEPSSYSWNIVSQYAAGVMGAWRGTSISPIDQSSGASAAGPSPLSD